MTIRTVEDSAPSWFTPARLFLDDIEEIIGIFQEAVQGLQAEDRARTEDSELKVTFSIGSQECDDLGDLPKLARKMTDLRIGVRRGKSVEVHLDFNRIDTLWGSSGFTEEEKWRTFRKLEPIFKRRKLRWRSWVHNHMALAIVLFALACMATMTSGLMLLDNKIPTIPKAVVFLPSLLLGVTIAMALFRNSALTLRHSWDPSPHRQYIRDKLFPVILGALLGASLGIGGTLLVQYVTHKYWH